MKYVIVRCEDLVPQQDGRMIDPQAGLVFDEGPGWFAWLSRS